MKVTINTPGNIAGIDKGVGSIVLDMFFALDSAGVEDFRSSRAFGGLFQGALACTDVEVVEQ